MIAIEASSTWRVDVKGLFMTCFSPYNLKDDDCDERVMHVDKITHEYVRSKTKTKFVIHPYSFKAVSWKIELWINRSIESRL